MKTKYSLKSRKVYIYKDGEMCKEVRKYKKKTKYKEHEIYDDEIYKNDKR